MIEDMRQFIESVEKTRPSDVLHIIETVDPKFEITAYLIELERMKRDPILVFENVKGYDMPIVGNIFPSVDRVATVMRTTRDKVFEEWLSREKNPVKPQLVNKGFAQDSVLTGDDVDLTRLPIPTHFAEDGGPYIGSGIFVAKDPEGEAQNMSIHRLQLRGKDKFGTSLHSRKTLWNWQRIAEEKGEPLEVAIVIGPPPVVLLASSWRGPPGQDEVEIAGAFAGEPVDVMECKTVDLMVPAQSEIVLEGEILANAREPEGPLGEYTGYASHKSTENVVKIKAITHRNHPFFHNITPGFTAEHEYLGGNLSREPYIWKAVREAVPGVKSVAFSPSAPIRYFCYISIKKVAEGQAKQAALAALGVDHGIKIVVVVDDDIDVRNESEVLWAISTRFQAQEDLTIIPRVMDSILDPSSHDGTSDKVIIDTTKPLTDWKAERCTVPSDLLASVRG
jgi:2,5-furandicarboxylate decarboxylase 1